MSEELDRYYSQSKMPEPIRWMLIYIGMLSSSIGYLWEDWKHHHHFDWWHWGYLLTCLYCLSPYVRVAYQVWKKRHPKKNDAAKTART